MICDWFYRCARKQGTVWVTSHLVCTDTWWNM